MIQSGNVRTLTEEDGTILFCGKDVAEALGYARPNEAVTDHCRGVTLKRRTTDTIGRMQETAFITEPDLYRLIVASKLPSAQKFERWVFDGGLIKHPVRIVEKDGEPWWVAKDVCEILELGNPRTSVALLEEDEKGDVHIMDAIGRAQATTIISEAGLYSLILRSRNPQNRPRSSTITKYDTYRKKGKSRICLCNNKRVE